MFVLNTENLFQAALEEDAVRFDVTTESLVAQVGDLGTVRFVVKAKAPGILSGTRWLRAAESLGKVYDLRFLAEGQRIGCGDEVLSGRADLKTLLGVERSLLNGLQHLCGIATLTRRVVDRVNAKAHSFRRKPHVFHTRKTLPLWRDLQIQAVVAGGGHLHRHDLAQRILFKENHKYLLAKKGKNLRDYIQGLGDSRATALIEVENETEALEAVACGAQHLLLDNFSPDQIAALLPKLPANLQLEVSGGLNEDNVLDYVMEGVDRLSLGALTHSVKALDLSLDWSIE